jgi:hypothetical protein
MDTARRDILMKTDNPIKLAVEAALKGAQFLRKSNTWYRDLKETIILVDVQKSNFGEQYYVNLGVLVKGLAQSRDKLPPRENECHVRLRLESLTPEAEQYVQQVVLNLDNTSMGPAERQQRIHDLIAEVALPFLLRCSTRAGIREADLQGRLHPALVHKSVREMVLS